MSSHKNHRHGTHRMVAPEETAARISALAGPLGITRVANVTGLDCIGIPVTMVSRPNSSSLSVSQGKGLDLDAARASGLMEATELYHAEHILHPLKLASWHELCFTHELVSVEKLPRISVSSFDGDTRILWIAGTDLFTTRELWVPYEMVHTNFTIPLPTGSGCFVMSSNGLASGNHLLEAIVHGLSEVIERDADSLFRLSDRKKQERRRVDPTTIQDSACLRLLESYLEAGVIVGIWDITSDIGIPAFRCVISDSDENGFRPLGPIEGMGCHPQREIALCRALTEAAQGRLTFIAGSRDDNGRSRYATAQNPELFRHTRARLLQPGTRSFQETPTLDNPTFEEDIQALLSGLRRAGLEQAVVVDLTKPEFEIPVVRVVIPGLETYHRVPGYTPGPRAKNMALFAR